MVTTSWLCPKPGGRLGGGVAGSVDTGRKYVSRLVPSVPARGLQVAGASSGARARKPEIWLVRGPGSRDDGAVRTIGLIGGMSWYSTLEYYRVINTEVQRRRGGHTSAPIALQSLDFADVRRCQQDEDWAAAGRLLGEAARRCEAGGADVVLICTNLMHKVADDVAAAVSVPLLHIADAVAAEAGRHGWTRLGLLGTRWVMEETFYADRLATHGISVVVPDAAGREMVDRVVFDELTQGRIVPASRAAYAEVVADLAAQGAEAVVLACTEIGLLLSAADSPLPLLDSMQAHALAAVDLALAEPSQAGAEAGYAAARVTA
jgi:aspartate racemase